MHPAVVVDASVWISYLVADDSNHEVSAQWVEDYLSRGGRLTAPGFLIVEVAAAISRRTGLPAIAKQSIRYTLYHSTMRLVPMEPPLLHEAAEIAADLRLKAGDAAYVEVAHQLAIPFVSWDREQLTRAAPLIETYTPDSYSF